MDTPIGQFLLIGNFRRRLARELLVIIYRNIHGPGGPLVSHVVSWFPDSKGRSRSSVQVCLFGNQSKV